MDFVGLRLVFFGCDGYNFGYSPQYGECPQAILDNSHVGNLTGKRHILLGYPDDLKRLMYPAFHSSDQRFVRLPDTLEVSAI